MKTFRMIGIALVAMMFCFTMSSCDNEENEALAKDIPQLQEIAGKVWKKEDELKQLKSELSALDRKIQLELAPPTPVGEGLELKNENLSKPKAEATSVYRGLRV